MTTVYIYILYDVNYVTIRLRTKWWKEDTIILCGDIMNVFKNTLIYL